MITQYYWENKILVFIRGFFLILCHGVHRDNKHLESQKHPYNIFKGFKLGKSIFFISLHTGKESHSNNWVELPIDDEILNRVKELARIEKNPTFDQYPMFERET